jgi:uncharacterized protein (DUF362 family)
LHNAGSWPQALSFNTLLKSGDCLSVFIAKEDRDLRKALRSILECYEGRIDSAKGIFIKPNIVFPLSEKSGQITRHKIVRNLIELLKERYEGVKIVLGEGTAAGTIPAENFEVSGYAALARELGVELLDLNRVEHYKIKWKYGMLRLPTIARDMNYINLPILKQSSAAVISAAMKNQKGLLLPEMKKAFHRWGLHEPIAHLNAVIQPGLTILDASNFFKGSALFSGNNTCEIDSLVVKLLGIPEPEYLKAARSLSTVTDDFEVLGEKPETVEIKRFPKLGEYRSFLQLRLWSNPRACSMCRFLLQDVARLKKNDLVSSFSGMCKLMRLAVTGAEFVYGFDPKFRHKHRKVVCIGDCTKKLAKEKGCTHVPGCPPDRKALLDKL